MNIDSNCFNLQKKNLADVFETYGILKLFSMTLLPLIITAFWWKDFFFLVFLINAHGDNTAQWRNICISSGRESY